MDLQQYTGSTKNRYKEHSSCKREKRSRVNDMSAIRFNNDLTMGVIYYTHC